MFDWTAFQAGALAFLLAFTLGGFFTIGFKFVYQLATPYNERQLIRDGNVAAAIALAGALIGYVLPLFSALSHTVSLMEFSVWALLSGVVQITTFLVISRLVFSNLAARIEANDIAAAIYLASISLCVGCLNAASMTT